MKIEMELKFWLNPGVAPSDFETPCGSLDHYLIKSSNDIQNTPSWAPCTSSSVRSSGVHSGDWSDQSPVHEKRPHGLRRRTSLSHKANEVSNIIKPVDWCVMIEFQEHYTKSQCSYNGKTSIYKTDNSKRFYIQHRTSQQLLTLSENYNVKRKVFNFDLKTSIDSVYTYKHPWRTRITC